MQDTTQQDATHDTFNVSSSSINYRMSNFDPQMIEPVQTRVVLRLKKRKEKREKRKEKREKRKEKREKKKEKREKTHVGY